MKLKAVSKISSFRVVLTLTFVLHSLGCASSELALDSAPQGAEVGLIRSDGSLTRLGKTPLVLRSESAPELFRQGGELEIKKDGYQTEGLLIPPLSLPSTGKAFVGLKEGGASDAQNTKTVLEAARMTAEIINDIQRKSYSDAERKASIAVAKYPGVAVFHDLLGNTYYLLRNVSKALDSYKRSNELSPHNPETQRMIERLSLMGSSMGGEGTR